MNCEEFAAWKANRLNVDFSLTEEAMKHAAGCELCKKTLNPEDKGDALLLAAMDKANAEDLVNNLDFVFAPDAPSISAGRYRFYGICGALVAVIVVFALCSLLLL
jgi:hypothetical protein